MASRPVNSATARQRFEAVALPHLDAIYSAALRLAGNPDDAKDLLQDTILRAYRFFDQFLPDTNCRAWLLTILYNNFRNHLRRCSLHPVMPIGDD
ncbi:MAG TPA: sigma factor, partial [Candidatus Binataceae bacterium]|nr:sigma factor [Candidatus Binataceae bacterium]